MNTVQINEVNYVISNAEVAQFLNEYVYSDMIWGGEMDAFEPYEGIFELLTEAVNDEPMFGKDLLELLNN